ncbi:MAG TPA: class I SAM-dependent methyltransferase [Pyrinomonadaceae bacterium]|jgi:SAM-dependent methyltransferase
MRHPLFSSLVRPLLLAVWALAIACAIAPQIRRASLPTASPTLTQQSPTPDSSDAINRPTSKPYTGELSIFEDPKRDEKLQPDRIMDILGIKQGSNVADIGAGSGWFTVRAARRVGNSGTVYAVDINRDYLTYIENRSKRENLANIRVILGRGDDPLLPAKDVDAVLLLKTYHEIAQPIRLLERTREAMRVGALLGIIDRNGKGDDHGLNKEVVIKEAARAGFALVNQYDFVKPDHVDYFLVFRPSDSGLAYR